MEVITGILASLVAMALLAGVGLMTVVALCVMAVLGLLTEMSFRRLFFVSFGIGLIAPVLLGVGLSSALADGSLQRDLRGELGEVIQLPDDVGDNWQEALKELQELGQEQEAGNLTDEQVEARVQEIFGEFEDLQINIDVNGDGEADTGVPLDLPEQVEAGSEG